MFRDKKSHALIFYSNHVDAIRCNDLNRLMNAGPIMKSIDSSYLLYLAIKLENIDIVKHLIAEDVKMLKRHTEEACKRNNLNILIYLIDNKCPIDLDECCCIAIRECYQSISNYMLSMNPDWIHENVSLIISVGNLELVKKLYETGYRFESSDIGLTISCSKYKTTKPLEYDVHFEIVKYLYSLGVPLVEQSYHEAVQYDRLNILKWLVENNCPTTNTRSGRLITDLYLHSIGRTKCRDKCKYCNIDKIRIVKECDYGQWLSLSCIDDIIASLNS